MTLPPHYQPCPLKAKDQQDKLRGSSSTRSFENNLRCHFWVPWKSSTFRYCPVAGQIGTSSNVSLHLLKLAISGGKILNDWIRRTRFVHLPASHCLQPFCAVIEFMARWAGVITVVYNNPNFHPLCFRCCSWTKIVRAAASWALAKINEKEEWFSSLYTSPLHFQNRVRVAVVS